MAVRSRSARKSVKIITGSGSAPIEELESRVMLSLLGQQLYPSNYPWNQQITNAPVSPISTAVINNIIANNGGVNGPLHADFGNDSQTTGSALYGIPYNVVHGNTTPTVSVTISDTSESDVVPAPLLTSFVIEGDNQTGPPSSTTPNSGDSHMLVWDEDNNIAYEFYQASRPSQNGNTTWHAAGEAIWNMNNDSFRTIGETSVDAAGLSVLAGLARPDEALPTSQGGQGIITHALRFTLENNDILNEYLYPGSHRANVNTNTAVDPPMGARFRLKASVNISNFDPESKIIAQALKDYGLILADNGSDFFVSGASYSVNASNQFGLTWNNSDINDTHNGLKSLTFSDFEVVNLTPAVAAVSPNAAAAGTTITITGNGFSGAAGRLAVLFGSTASSTVTVVDDNHVTAVVPPGGSGTVNIVIQSGIAHTGDTENYTNSQGVWGYGKSTVVTADQFTFQSPATVSGRIFQDNNSNGAFDSGDVGLSGKTVYLDLNNDGSLDNGEPSTTTDVNGNYSFTGLAVGLSGTVRLQTQPSGFVLDNSAANGFTTTSGITSTVNLGYFPIVFGDGGTDLYTLNLDASGTHINIYYGLPIPANLKYIAPTALPPSLTFNLGAGNDALTIDLTNGNPIPSGGVTYDGGAGADSLTIIGPAGNKNISVSATQVNVNGQIVNYANLESIAVNTGSGNDTLTQTAQPGNGATLSFTGGTGSDYLIVTGGTFTIPSDPTTSGTASLAVTVGGGANPASVIFPGSQTAGSGMIPYHLASLTVSSNGTATLAAATDGAAADRTLLTTGSLAVTGSLDITSNSVDVNYAANPDPFPAIRASILAGAITSSLDDASHAVGYADGADGIVAGLSSGDILIRYTILGDANLDGTVNFADLLILAQNYNATNSTWDTGDFNGDNNTNFADLLSLAQNYNASLPSAAPTITQAEQPAAVKPHHARMQH